MRHFTYKPPRKAIVCKDGFKISIQAGGALYSDPRDDEGPYTHVECGYPSEPEVLLIPFVEPGSEPFTDAVYGYVPAGVIDKVIRLHGGIKSGDLPELLLEQKDNL